MKSPMTRRELLRLAGVGSAGLLLAACQPKVVEKIVERTVVVTEEKVVQETVVVKEAVEVAKEVTRVVEKVVETGPAQLETQTLRFGYGGWAKDYADIMIANFQAMEPNVEVELEVIAGDLIQVLYTQAAAGTTGDVQWIADAHVMNLGHNGVMLDMTPLAEADDTFDLSDMYPIMLGLGKWQEKWYMIPWAADAPVLYYNKTMLEEAGAPLPDPMEGYTVQDMQLAAQAVHNEAEQIYGWNCSANWWAIYVPWVNGFGGSFYNEDKTKCTMDMPEAMEACQALADFYCKYEGAAVPVGAQFGGDPFILGRACFHMTNRFFCKNIRTAEVDFEWDVAIPPRQPVKHVAGAGTMGPGVTAAAAKRGTEWAAWKLASVIASPATQKHFARQYLSIPVLQSLAKDPSWYELEPPPANRDVFLKIPTIAITPPNPNTPDCGTVYVGETNKFMNEAWDEMRVGCVPATEALPPAVEAINNCMERAGRR
jgi:multiple sugar transport system substrate-binding protein